MTFLTALWTEFTARQQRNRRYSLRAFARQLGTDHSTLSQILRGRRHLSPRMLRLLGTRLRLDSELILEACKQLEAEKVCQLAQSPGFRTDSRWIATRTGIPVDAVNAALHRLLYQGSLVMKSPTRWSTNQTPYA